VSDQGKQDIHLEWLRQGGQDEVLRYIFSDVISTPRLLTCQRRSPRSYLPCRPERAARLDRTRQNASDSASRTPTETVAWAPACTYLDTYMLCGVY
jgi:hypothetical protein